MKILILGAAGQLGQEWQSFFDKQGQEYNVKTYSSAQLDITHSSKLSEVMFKEQPDVVINCAAYTDVDGAETDRNTARRVNVQAVKHLGKLSTEQGYKLIHYSTDYVFPGKLEDREKFPDGYPEDYPAAPVNYYGKTKWEGEQAIRRMTDHYLILRISWLCGVFGSNFINTMLRLGSSRNELQVVNDQWGSPTFAEDAVKHTWSLIEAGETGTFHSTSGGLITWYELANAIFEKKGIDVRVEAVTSEAFPTVADRPRFSKLDTKKISSIPGCVIEEWDTGLARLLEKL